MTRRERSQQRIQVAASKRHSRRVDFIVRRAKAKGYEIMVGENLCPAGCYQVVREVKPFAGAWLYRSCLCAGCYTRLQDAKPDGQVFGCALIQERWFLSFEKVEVGQQVIARDPLVTPLRHLRFTLDDIFRRAVRAEF